MNKIIFNIGIGEVIEHDHCILSDFQPPSVERFDPTSITLHWNRSSPELTGNPQRNITQYAVTISSQDGIESKVLYVPAEDVAMCTLTGLHSATTYDIEIHVIIDTEGQGDQTYDLGINPLIVTTREYRKNGMDIFSSFFSGINNPVVFHLWCFRFYYILN